MKRLYRSVKDQKLGGVMGGLGEYLNVDPNIVRLLAVVIWVITGFIPLLIAYLVAWMILPEEETAGGN